MNVAWGSGYLKKKHPLSNLHFIFVLLSEREGETCKQRLEWWNGNMNWPWEFLSIYNASWYDWIWNHQLQMNWKVRLLDCNYSALTLKTLFFIGYFFLLYQDDYLNCLLHLFCPSLTLQEMLFHHTCKLVEFENATKALEKAKPKIQEMVRFWQTCACDVHSSGTSLWYVTCDWVCCFMWFT